MQFVEKSDAGSGQLSLSRQAETYYHDLISYVQLVAN